MIGEILGKALVVVKGDTSHARAEIAKLSAEEQKAAKARIKAQEESNAAFERGQQRFALNAAGAAAGWALLAKGAKTYEEHLVSMGSAGEAELKKLRSATGALSDSQKNLEIAIGKLVVAAEPAARALAAMANELANIVTGIGNVIRKARDLAPDIPGVNAGSIGKWGGRVMFGAAGVGYGIYSDYFTTPDQYVTSAGFDYNEGNGPYQEESRIQLSPAEWRARGFVQQGDGTWRKPTAAPRRAGRSAPMVNPYAAAGADIFGQIGATSGYSSGRYSQADLDLLGLGAEGGPNVAGPSPWASVAIPQSLLDQIDQTIVSLEADKLAKEKSAMERILGPIEQFDAYAAGFGAISNAAVSAYEAIVTGSESAGAAIKRVLGAEIMGIGKSMFVRSLQEGAWAVADLAKGNLPGAATHAKAGAMFLAGSAIAGTIAAGLGAGGSSGNAQGSYAAAGIGGGARTNDRDQGIGLTVVMGDGLSDDSPRHIARRTRRNIDLARRYANTDGAVPG